MGIALGVLFLGAAVVVMAGLAEKAGVQLGPGTAAADTGGGRSGGARGTGGGHGSPMSTAGSNVPASGGTVIGNVTWGQLNAIGRSHGWSQAQIADWVKIIKSESNGTISDTNPSSGAYGIAQMLAPGGSVSNLGPNKQKYYAYGGNPNTVGGQLVAMANYIAQRYHTPSAAWSFHLAHSSY